MEIRMKSIRVDIDELAMLSGALKPSREISLAKTSFENSKMMLGKVLQTIGTANPYPESKNPKSSVIEPTADVTNKLPYRIELDHIAQVKSIRQDAEAVCINLKNEMITFGLTKLTPSKWETTLFLQESWMECQKGMMWLGMELGRIHREETPAPTAPGNVNEKAEIPNSGNVSMLDKIASVFKRTEPEVINNITQEFNNNPQTNN